MLYDTLLEKMDKDEILGVLAHEAGHWKKKHLLKMLVAYESIALIVMFSAFFILKGLGYTMMSSKFNETFAITL